MNNSKMNTFNRDISLFSPAGMWGLLLGALGVAVVAAALTFGHAIQTHNMATSKKDVQKRVETMVLQQDATISSVKVTLK